MTVLQVDNNQPVVVNEVSSNFPNGMKKAKKEKQENEMIDHMVKKFGVPSSNSLSQVVAPLQHLPMQDSMMQCPNFWRRLEKACLHG